MRRWLLPRVIGNGMTIALCPYCKNLMLGGAFGPCEYCNRSSLLEGDAQKMAQAFLCTDRNFSMEKLKEMSELARSPEGLDLEIPAHLVANFERQIKTSFLGSYLPRDPWYVRLMRRLGLARKKPRQEKTA